MPVPSPEIAEAEIEKREAEREVPWYKAIPGDEK
jgi:hypothetical protein